MIEFISFLVDMAIGPIVISYYVCISTLLCGLCRNCKATFTQYWTCSQL